MPLEIYILTFWYRNKKYIIYIWKVYEITSLLLLQIPDIFLLIQRTVIFLGWL